MKISSTLTTLMLLTALVVRIILIAGKVYHSDCTEHGYKITDSKTYSACENGVKYFLDASGAKSGYTISCDATYAPALKTIACIARELNVANIVMLVSSSAFVIIIAFLLLFGRNWIISRVAATLSLWLALNGNIFSPLMIVFGSTTFALTSDLVFKLLIKLCFLAWYTLDTPSRPSRHKKRAPGGRFVVK